MPPVWRAEIFRIDIVDEFDVIVVGQGIAGLATAKELAARGMKVGTFEAEFFGGLVANRVALDFFPLGEGLTGMDFAAELAAANARSGVTSHQNAVTAMHSAATESWVCLLYTSPSPRDLSTSRMPSSA